MEEGKRRDGRAIEILGFYNPLVSPPQVSIKRDRVDYWLSRWCTADPQLQQN